MSLPQAGTCRHCQCTEERPCTLRTGEPCSWADRERTICNGDKCLAAEAARRAAVARATPRSQYAGMGYGHIVRLKRMEDRRRKRRKGRAA